MNKHHTKMNGDLAVGKTIVDLMSKGFFVGTMLHEHLPFDLIAYDSNRFYRIQVKYRTDGFLPTKCTNGLTTRTYTTDDFDYYALYLPDVDCVVYPHIRFAGSTISSQPRNSATPYYWYKDFLTFTDTAEKTRSLTISRMKGLARISTRKVARPLKNDLIELLSAMPCVRVAERFGVSDNAVRKWAQAYEIDLKCIRRGKPKFMFRFSAAYYKALALQRKCVI